MSPPNPSSETPSEPVTSPTREVRQMPGRFGIALNVAVQVLLTGVLFLGANILSFQYYKR